MGHEHVAACGISCDACGLCVRGCPARAIAWIGQRPLWRWRCEGCERCINLCPRRAVQLSIARLVVFSLPFAWNPIVAVGWLILPRLAGAAGWVESAILHLVAYPAIHTHGRVRLSFRNQSRLVQLRL